MKAKVINRFGNTNVFEFSEIPYPELKSDEIIIKTVSGSVNPIDWKQRQGKHRFIFGFPFPIVLGYDVAGIVVKTGLDVREFKTGDKVCGVLNNKYGGGLAEFTKSNGNCFVKIHEDMDLIRSAAIPLAGLTSLQALRDKGNLRKGDKLMIIGAAGGVGHIALQIANIFGAESSVVSSKRHYDFLEKIGFSSFIDYEKTNILNIQERFDVIFDTVGKFSFLKCKHLLKPGGIYINTLPRPKILIHKIISLFCSGKKAKTLLMKHSQNDLNQLIKWIVEGKLHITIDKTFSINEVNKAHQYSEDSHAEGKILIQYNWN